MSLEDRMMNFTKEERDKFCWVSLSMLACFVAIWLLWSPNIIGGISLGYVIGSLVTFKMGRWMRAW